ncbi:hypothetical protein [uncultured Brevundimonas sp.]|uniref:hypothetical protein n=1 Tax=uncultured Brevundimonas sp. TaxID=213418 RepID=UPI0030EE01EF|tara:strand:+ start:8544 stop:9650 length:1107 start_codon:yes stop_codon:yes gene_type:complete
MTPVGLYQRGLTIGRNTRLRRAAYAVAIVVAAVLAVFPRSYVAYAKFLPQESTSGGAQVLAQVSSGVTNIASALSSQRGSYVIIGRSNDVQLEALKRLKAMGYAAFADQDDARVRLEKKVEIHVLSGGVIEVRSRDHDQKFARDLVVAYTAAVEKHLADLGVEQVEYKRRLVTDRWDAAREELDLADQALLDYRLRYNLASPESTLGQNLTRRLGYESALQAKEVQLETLRSVAADSSFQIRQIRNEMNVLRRQIAQLDNPGDAESPYRLSNIVTDYQKLFRKQQYALTLVEGYRRFFEAIAIQEVTSQTNLQIIEHPFVDPARHFNLAFVGLFLALVLLAIFTEWYVPFTGLGGRPRLGRAGRNDLT